jgi:outer membrane biosynthesis protein TonB
MEIITFSILAKTKNMNLRISLIAFFLFGIGIFANAQYKKQHPAQAKPAVENGADAIPITVTSSNKKNKPKPPKAPEPVKFTPPVIVKNADKAPPPPPPPSHQKKKMGELPPPPPPPQKQEDGDK